MPVIDTERPATRSVLRHRPLHVAPAGSGLRRKFVPADVASSVAAVTADEQEQETRIPVRRLPAHRQTPVSPASRGRQSHPCLFFCLGLGLAILLWVAGVQVVDWGTNALNTLRYGSPRIFQIDAVVGNGDNASHPSHFLAINLHGQVSIIEFPAGNAAKALVLASTTISGPNANQIVPTLQFIDLAHNGQPDLLVNIGGVESLLVNDQGNFQVPTPAQEQQLLNELHELTSV